MGARFARNDDSCRRRRHHGAVKVFRSLNVVVEPVHRTVLSTGYDSPVVASGGIEPLSRSINAQGYPFDPTYPGVGTIRRPFKKSFQPHRTFL